MTTKDILAPEMFDCKKTFRSFCEAIGCKGDHNLIECSFNVCCEAKKTCAFEENFWESDIQFVVKNDGVYTYFNEMKDFLFNLQEMDLVFKNKLIGVLFFVLVKIYFGLDKNKFQICVISFCLEYYFVKKNTTSALH